MLTRRHFFLAGAAAWAAPGRAADRRFTLAFTPGSIGVSTDQRGAIDFAQRYGYESVQPFAGDLGELSPAELAELQAELQEKNLTWASAGLPVDFRRDEERFRQGLGGLAAAAEVYERAGVRRISTWLSPASDERTYLENFRLTARRLREIATICEDHGLRFGLEYVGTPTLRFGRRHPFVHSLAETKELIAEIGKTNVGFVLDTWHWWTADETREDLLTLSANDVVSADLNDAPAGIPKLQQYDSSRELPMATGVIPVADFLEALVEIGFDGPIRPEPFNRRLNEMDNEGAAEAAAAAMKKAFRLVA